VEEGSVSQRPNVHLDADEVAEGWVLACQAEIEGDAVVFVPPQEKVERRISERSGKRAIPTVSCDFADDPTLRQVCVEVSPPSLQDNTNDLDRLKRDLGKQFGWRDISIDLAVLSKLAGTLRQGGWTATAVLDFSRHAPDGGSPPRLIEILPGDQTGTSLGVAVDIGTTGNVVYLVDLKSGEVLERAADYNGQISCGEDVISRIIYAKREGGLQQLKYLVLKTIDGLLKDIYRRAGIQPQDIHKMVVAGNTTMIHLFLGLDPKSIREEPYVPTVNSPPIVTAQDLGFDVDFELDVNPHAVIDCLPGVGSYVGADITAGVLSSGMFKSDQLTLFIDVGTNGEIVLGKSDWLISCACSAGPAFEGSGVRSGMRASVGAIEEVWINSRTYEPTYQVIGEVAPRGICGSGMISLLAEMFMSGVIDKSGQIRRDLSTSRIREGEHGAEYVVAWAEEAEEDEDVVIMEVDISNLIRAKAAIYAGFSVLVSSVGLQMDDVERVLVGGAFGEYINVEKAIQIGLLPDMPWDKIQFLGNTSILGAYAALLCGEMRRSVEDIARMMTYLELSADNSFMNEFTSSLFLPHTNLELFPSVAQALEGQGGNAKED
jgi:uncharacterized 2Fe-2S/4Fe-4S cluster protein (DUF4445 family)